MAQQNRNQQVSGNYGGPGQPNGMLGMQQQTQAGPRAPGDTSANMAYPWMQAGKWAGMNGGGPYAGSVTPTTTPTGDPMARSSALNLDSTYTGGPITNSLGSGPNVGSQVSTAAQTGGPNASQYVLPAVSSAGPTTTPVPYNGIKDNVGGNGPGGASSFGSPYMGNATTGPTASEANAIKWFEDYYKNAPLDSMNYPIWPDFNTWPQIEGQSWGTQTSSTPRYSYGVPAATAAQMQNFLDTKQIAPLPGLPGEDGGNLYHSLQASLGGAAPTNQQVQTATTNQWAGDRIQQYLTDPMYTAVGPGGLTRGQTELMTLQKGGLLPKNLLI